MLNAILIAVSVIGVLIAIVVIGGAIWAFIYMQITIRDMEDGDDGIDPDTMRQAIAEASRYDNYL